MNLPYDTQLYLRLAYQAAWKLSDDKDTKNGAVLAWNTFRVIEGANRLPRNINVLTERTQRPLKYKYLEHAERDVIFEAARIGMPPTSAVLFCPWFACAECARAIIASGIRTVVGHKAMMDKTPDRWKADVDIGLDMLKEADVETIFYKGKIGGVTALFDGQEWQP